MVCKIILPVKRNRAAFSFVELMVSLSLASLVALALAALAYFSAKRFTASTTEAELSYMSRNAVDSVTSDVRQMLSVSSWTTNEIILLDLAGAATTYSWSPATKIFQKQSATQTKILLTDCDWLSFGIYSANPIDGVLDIQPTTKLAECKAIKMRWSCSRTNWNAALKVEVSAAQTIVLRAKGI